MSLATIPADTTPAVERASNQVRQIVGSTLSHADAALLKIRNLVREHGRAAISAELGGDAAALLTVYNSLKSAVETGKQTTLDDLP